ncbi:glycoside hydrolase family 1 protein [Spiroplasma endosymbiont of Crioceris asparagi]|uniref:glycoside hydrolase family 1 protein n=1 Tax=Spiroplasma endosymbiont of Crioceris asparagi TaxID=3066286 RepID=UPI0030D60B07
MRKNFLWGASTSAYQVEGAWDQDGKGRSVQDKNTPSQTNSEISDFKVCADHYNRWKEDVKLFAELGLKAYRLSIAWTRIIPDGVGKVNEKGVKFYKDLIAELKKNNIEPIITMYHFDLPEALEKQGGWSNREMIVPAFVNYAKVLFTEFGKDINYWLTINEQNVMVIAGHIIGIRDEQGHDHEKSLWQQNHNMMIAQAKVIELCRKMTKAKIGPAPNISTVYAETSKPEDVIAMENFNAYRNWLYLDLSCRGKYNGIVWNFFEKNDCAPEIKEGDLELLKANRPDFIAFNYYGSGTVKFNNQKLGEKNLHSHQVDQQKMFNIPGMFNCVANKNLPKTEFGWEIDAVGFRTTLRQLWDRYQLPLIITENGLGSKDVLTNDFKIHDDYRIDYLKQHVEQLKLAEEEDKIDVFGYSPWSAIDLISTHEGIEKRYGFIYVNRDEKDLKDLKRYKKDSFFWYQNVIKTNGEEL